MIPEAACECDANTIADEIREHYRALREVHPDVEIRSCTRAGDFAWTFGVDVPAGVVLVNAEAAVQAWWNGWASAFAPWGRDLEVGR
jgi:hypothetical protein